MNTRINVNVMSFGTGPARVEAIRSELGKQRTVYRAAAANTLEEDAIRRNIEDLEPLLASAEANEALRVKHAAERQAAEDAKTNAHRVAAEDAVRAELRTRYLSLPGTTGASFDDAYPTLLADHHRREMAKSGDALAQARNRLGRL
ncbi:MAG: hypothetical protein ACR2OE_13230 [Thermomicrobiales bacterium]